MGGMLHTASHSIQRQRTNRHCSSSQRTMARCRSCCTAGLWPAVLLLLVLVLHGDGGPMRCQAATPGLLLQLLQQARTLDMQQYMRSCRWAGPGGEGPALERSMLQHHYHLCVSPLLRSRQLGALGTWPPSTHQPRSRRTHKPLAAPPSPGSMALT